MSPCPCKIQRKLLKDRYSFDAKKEIYLDYNATSPPDRQLLAQFQNLSLKAWGHPMSAHGTGSAAFEQQEIAAEILQEELGCPEGDFYFSSSGTESLYWAILLLSKNADGNPPIYVSALNHPAVFNALEQLSMPYQLIPVDDQGKMQRIDLNPTEPPLLIHSPVNYETGGIDLGEEMLERIHQLKGKVLIDAVQAFPRLEESNWQPHADLFVLSGHKFQVPKGISLLGGPEMKHIAWERRLPRGSSNPLMQRILAEGIRLHRSRRWEMNRNLELQEREILRFLKRNLMPIRIESPADKVPGVLNISLLPKCNMEDLFEYLATHRVSISRFCACSGKVEGTSQVLSAMGINEERASRSLRLSGGLNTQRSDWQDFFGILSRFLRSQ